MRDWNRHYADLTNINSAPEPLLVELADSLPPGQALDIACGAGRHAIYLARLGWQVTAVDSSPEAIRRLRLIAGALPVDARIADLELGEFAITPSSFDLICDFFYLQHDLFPQIREGVRPGGAFAAALHLLDPDTGPGAHNPAFLVRPGELRAIFADWKILFYSEGLEAGRKRRAARIIARRA